MVPLLPEQRVGGWPVDLPVLAQRAAWEGPRWTCAIGNILTDSSIEEGALAN